MGNIKHYNTLFLDRDGVINRQRPNDYVKSPEEFIFIEGVTEALKLLAPLFSHILIVTNQRGVGRGLMTEENLGTIHRQMLETIQNNGGRIDKIYVCTDTDPNNPNRKPNPGMAMQALQDFPDINFSQSLLAGDSLSDIEFANNAHIPAVLIGNKYKEEELAGLRIYRHYPDLLTFATEINKELHL